MVCCIDGAKFSAENCQSTCGKRNVLVSLLERSPWVKILLMLTFSNLTRVAWHYYQRLYVFLKKIGYLTLTTYLQFK